MPLSFMSPAGGADKAGVQETCINYRAFAADAPACAGTRQGVRYAGVKAGIAVFLIAVAGYACTSDQRTFYSDDYPLRALVAEHGWPAAYGPYFETWGAFRSLGGLSILGSFALLWDHPAIQHALLVLAFGIVCLLVWRLVWRLTGDSAVGVVAASIFGAWHSYTPVVSWTTSGSEMLPATICFLTGLLAYVRYLQHESAGAGRRWWMLGLVLFGLSILFHDQHLGAAAVFSALAWLGSARDGRWQRVAWTIPFWFVSVAVGAVSMATSEGAVRPLEPTVAGLATQLGKVLAAWGQMCVLDPVAHWMGRWGTQAALSEFAAEDRARLALSVLGLASGAVLIGRIAARRSREPASSRQAALLVLMGLLLALATLSIMALHPTAGIKPRHTFWSAMGLALILAAGFAILRGHRGRRIGTVAVVTLIVGLSIARLGYVYQWTIRSRVTDRVIACLADLDPAPGDLVVIDGVRKYGRGFADSWGLSGALSQHHGVEIRATTMLRREGDRLIANAAWDRPWAVDLATARFFTWRDDEQSLRPDTFAGLCRRHPELSPGGHQSAH